MRYDGKRLYYSRDESKWLDLPVDITLVTATPDGYRCYTPQGTFRVVTSGDKPVVIGETGQAILLAPPAEDDAPSTAGVMWPWSKKP